MFLTFVTKRFKLTVIILIDVSSLYFIDNAASNKFPEESAGLPATYSTASSDTGFISAEDNVSYSTQASNNLYACPLTPGATENNFKSYNDKDYLVPESTLEFMLSPEMYSNEELMCEFMTELLEPSSAIHEAENTNVEGTAIASEITGADQEKLTYHVLNLFATPSSEILTNPKKMAQDVLDYINDSQFTNFPVKLRIHIQEVVYNENLELTDHI
ncbi:hypothetical protein BDQ17DRAFT_1333779 [Cyathus striatus]|nr:hypothetical protein BDQ17DRAFT_1333779 [Cyathus striatus]